MHRIPVQGEYYDSLEGIAKASMKMFISDHPHGWLRTARDKYDR